VYCRKNGKKKAIKECCNDKILAIFKCFISFDLDFLLMSENVYETMNEFHFLPFIILFPLCCDE